MFFDIHLVFASLWLINCVPSTLFSLPSNTPNLHIKLFLLLGISPDFFMTCFFMIFRYWFKYHIHIHFPYLFFFFPFLPPYLLIEEATVMLCNNINLIFSTALISTSSLSIFTTRSIP